MVIKTIEHKMTATEGHSSGFNYLRLILSISVIAFHTILVCYGREVEIAWWTGSLKPLIYFIVPSFFALSGFLVTASLVRVNYHASSFLVLRTLRILPALCCVVLVSTLLIGPALTELPLKEYFSDSLFFLYFLNIVGSAHFVLPGLFSHAPAITLVDIQIWTLPYEIRCYILMAILAIIGVIKRPLWLAAGTLLFTLLMYMNDLYSGYFFFHAQPAGYFTVACFLWGALLYLYREKIPYNLTLFWGAVILTWLTLMYTGGGFTAPWWGLAYSDMTYVTSLPIAYITAYIGLMNPRKIFLVSSGDYSYGLYLYGFPIQQAVYQLFPACRVWYLHFPLSLFLTGICAYLSWTFLESKILDRKKQALIFVQSLSARMQRVLSSFRTFFTTS